MRTTVDIPDPVYRELKIRAAREGTSIKELILRGVSLTLQPPGRVTSHKNTYPLISSKNPGSMKLGEEGVYEYIPFP